MKKFCIYISITCVFFLSIIFCACTNNNQDKELNAPKDNEIQVVNYNPVWGDVDSNVSKISKMSTDAKSNGAKMIVFPAMSLSGFMTEADSQLAHDVAIEVCDARISPIAKTADVNDIWIVFGAIEKKNNELFNSTIAISPEGYASVYEEIVPTSNLFSAGEYPVCIDTEWGYVGLTVGNDFINVPEISQYYVAVDVNGNGEKFKTRTCNLIVGSLAYNEGCSIANPNCKPCEWTLLNRANEISYNNMVACAVSNLSGKQNNEMFPGGSFIFSVYKDANGKIQKRIFAGGTYESTQYNLYVGPAYEDKVFSMNLGVDYDIWKKFYIGFKQIDGTINPNFHANTKLYAKLYKELDEKYKSGELTDHKYLKHTDIGVAAVNTCCPVWGNKKAGLDNVEKYIIEAGEKKNVDIIVFPEVALTGYSYSKDNFNWEDYNPLTGEVKKSDGKTESHCALAETIPGPTTQYLSEYAKKYNMYIVFGMAETPEGGLINENGVDKCYNSAAILCPDGSIEKYRKIHLTNDEDKWAVCAEDPFMMNFKIDGQDIKVGFSICRDAQFYPEVYRYYAACGIDLLVHFSASSQNRFDRECVMGSYSSRDKIGVIATNLWGTDGPSEKTFNAKYNSLVCSPRLSGGSEYDQDGRNIELYGFGKVDVSPEGLECGTTIVKGKGLDLYNCGFTKNRLNFEVIAKMFDELSTKFYKDYKPLYSGAKDRDCLGKAIKIDY